MEAETISVGTELLLDHPTFAGIVTYVYSVVNLLDDVVYFVTLSDSEGSRFFASLAITGVSDDKG